MHHVVIACSYKFEDVNLLLEVLKLNFQNPPYVHVFCNLNTKDFKTYSDILNFDLIDDFHHIPEEKCFVGNNDRDTKRRQPLDMFQKISQYMSSIGKNFAFLEGDNYPLVENSFYGPLVGMGENDVFANLFYFNNVDLTKISRSDHIEVIKISASQMHKMPEGFILPAPMYIGHKAAEKISKFITENYELLLDGKKNFEGCLGVIFKQTGVNRKNVSDYFCYSYPVLNQIDPVSYVIHHHNILNLRNLFVEYGITKGSTFKLISENDSYKKRVEGCVLSFSDTKFEICKLNLRDCNGL